MKEIELQLVPQPGSKPEFLAKLAVVDPSPVVSKVWTQMINSLKVNNNNNENATPMLVLEAYTRETWAWKPTTASNNAYQTIMVQSIDGRHKLPGFIKYLKDRQKSAFGRFGQSGIWVVSYIQSKAVLSTGNDDINKERMECRIALDCTLIPNCPLKPRTSATPAAAISPPPAQVAATIAASAAGGAASKRKGAAGGNGLLGKLVGAQHRTNQHVIAATARPTAVAKTATTTAPAALNDHTATGDAVKKPMAVATAVVPTRTAQAVLVEFRQDMEQKMLDFDESPEQILRVELNLAQHTVGLSDTDKVNKVTMEILKYMVYEACEEVNDEWIAHKEPSEFMDEVVICVYKPGAAIPPEVLEEINKGELPDEVIGQQRALAEEQMRRVNQAERQKAKTLETVAHQFENDVHDDADEDGGGGGPAALGTKKRDRRSVEEYELEKKRGRTG